MKIKLNINKEQLLKHRFWVMLAATVCVILFGLMFLGFNVDADETAKSNGKVIDDTSRMKGPFESLASIAERRKSSTAASKTEKEVWIDAYNAEKSLFMFPKKVEDEFQFAEGYFATDINITPATDVKNPKAWPADSEFLMNGELIDHAETWFKLKDRNGKILQIFTTESTTNVNVVGQPKPVNFQKLPELQLLNKFAAVNFQRGRYFYDKLTVPQRESFALSYKSQIHDILRIVDPLDDKGEGVVQLRDWLYKPDEFPDEKKLFIRYVGADGKGWNTGNDFSREAWIAQENLWIQHEIYRIIREANDTIARFKGPLGEEKTKGPVGEEKNKPYKFENSYFELILSLNAGNELSFTIKNRLPRRQRIDLSFRVLMNKDKSEFQKELKPEVVRITAPPLAARGDPKKGDTYTKLVKTRKDAVPRKGIYAVEQVLSWETAAVKRIDQISIGSNAGDDISHSHRTYENPLISIKTDDDDPVVAPGPPQRGVKPPPGKGPGKGRTPIGGGGGGGGGGAGGVNTGLLEHGLWKDRYLEVSPQSRRVPVGIVLIVDQLHVDRVMTSFDNSKLRFLPTQVLLNQYAGSLQPPAVEDKSKDAGAAGPGFGPRPNPFGQPAPTPSAGGGGSSLDTNMEMVIYGIMTLYERYPPRPVAAPKKAP